MRGYKPLLMMRARGLKGPFMCKAANLTSHLVKSVGNWIGLGGGGIFEDLDFIAAYKGATDVQAVNIDGAICNLMPKGVITATSSHSTTVMALDYQGVYQEYPIDAPVWKWGRMYTNLYSYSDDLTQTVWSKIRAAVTDSSIFTPSVDNNTHYLSQSSQVDAGSDYTFNVLASAEGYNILQITSGSGFVEDFANIDVSTGAILRNNFEPGHVLTTEILGGKCFIRLTIPGSTTTATGRIYLIPLNADIDARLPSFIGDGVSGMRLENNQVVKSSDQLPFIPTTATPGVRTYATGPSGSPLPQHPYLQANKAATNLLYPSEPPVTTSYTIPATEHILWIEGTGSITSSYGTATEASPLIFTGTAASATFTVVGSVDIAQIELGNIKQVYIPTTTAAESIPALAYTYPAANIDPADSVIEFKIDYQGDDTGVIDIGGVGLLTLGDIGDGNELMPDPELDDPTGWTLGTGVTLDNGALHFTGNANSATSIDIFSGLLNTQCVVEITISNYVSGEFNINCGGKERSGSYAGNGTHYHYSNIADDFLFYIQETTSAGGFVGDVSYVSAQSAIKGIILDDGSGNIINAHLSTGQHEIKVILGTATMALYVDGALIANSVYVPIVSGLITAEEDMWALGVSPVVTQPVIPIPPPVVPVDCATILYASHLDTDATNINIASNVTGTLAGDGSISAADSKFGAGSALLPYTANTILNTTGDSLEDTRTISWFFKVTEAGQATHGLLYTFGNQITISLKYNTDPAGELAFKVKGITDNVFVAVPRDVWHHMAMTVGGGLSTELYFNGNLVSTGDTYDTSTNNSFSILFGTQGSVTLGGFIDDVLITNTLDYTADFTPPTAPFETTCSGVSLGPELVLNGGFDTDTIWTKTGSSTISGGTGIFSPGDSSGQIRQREMGATVDGVQYLTSFDIVSISTGAVNMQVDVTQLPATVNAPGTYENTLTMTRNEPDALVYMFGLNTDAVIDNISVKEIL